MNQLANRRKIMEKVSLSQPQITTVYRFVLIASVLTNLLLLMTNHQLNHLYDMTIKDLEQEMFFSDSNLTDKSVVGDK